VRNNTAGTHTEGLAPADGVTPLRSKEYWLFRILPLNIVIPAAVVAIAGALIAVACKTQWYVYLSVGLFLFLLGTARIRDVNISGIIGKRIAFQWHKYRRRNSTVVHDAPFDVPVPDSNGQIYGMRWDGDCLITMLRVDAPARGLTLLAPDTVFTDNVLPLPEIARCLTQFDIGLAAIDIISTGSRSYGNHTVARLYDTVLGPLPAIAHRTVWLALRLDPLANAKAVDSRGGGPTGSIRSAIVATRRVANRLATKGIKITVLSAGEMHTAVSRLTHNINIDKLDEAWNTTRQGQIELTSYEVHPDLLDSPVLASVWAVPAVATTLTLRLRPAVGPGNRLGAPGGGRIAVSATVRYDTVADPDVKRSRHTPPAAGLRSLAGAQHRSLLSTLPVGHLDIGATTSSYGEPDSLQLLTIPTTGCGQLVGADQEGRGVAVALVGYSVRHVEIIGTLQLAQQVILRSIALGAKVVVHTDRAGAWGSMINRVGAPDLLSLSSWSTGNQQQAHQTIAANVIVYDGVAPSTQMSEATVIYLRPRGKAPEHPEADVTLTQSANATDMIAVRTSSGTTQVRMVATQDELNYLNAGFASWQTAASGPSAS
jgi:type VII secretion protein EccE